MTGRPRPSRRLLGSLGFGLVVLVAVIALWPARLGGAASFVVVRGHSMDPTYALGDVVYVRAASEYRPGDIVVYRVPKGQPGAGINIVHRLSQVLSDGTMVLQGDNNPEPDVFRPTRTDVVGRAVVDLGPVPLRIAAIAPLMAAIVVAIAIAALLWPDSDEPELGLPVDEVEGTESFSDTVADDVDGLGDVVSASRHLAPRRLFVGAKIPGEPQDPFADDVLHDLRGAALDGVGSSTQEVLGEVVAEERGLGLVHFVGVEQHA